MTKQRRKNSLRLHGYNYSQNGAYFITICTHRQTHLFGEIRNEMMHLNAWGEIAREEWLRTGDLRDHVNIDAYVIMPNHIHGIIVITDMSDLPRRGAARCAPASGNREDPVPGVVNRHDIAPGSLGAIVRAFKSAVTKRIREQARIPDFRVWQRGYHDHIIRNERSYAYICNYVETNPARWDNDSLNPNRNS